MRRLLVCVVFGTLMFALSLNGQVAQATERYPLGHYEVQFNDPDCPGNPDSFHVYVVFGNQWGVTDTQYAGYTTYWCKYGIIDATFAYSPYWIQCTNYYNSDYCPHI